MGERSARQLLDELPEGQNGELVEGELRVSPRPAPGHLHVGSVLGAELTGPFLRGKGGPGGWWILDEPELHLGPDVLIPDIAGWRRERLPALPSTPAFEVAPDWVCEILSPSTAAFDRARKLPAYGRHGVAHAWLIDPEARTLEVFRREGPRWLVATTHAGDEAPRVEPFEAIVLELPALWSGATTGA